MLDNERARWFVPDPANQYWSGYVAMGNNPVSMVDPDGRQTNGESTQNKNVVSRTDQLFDFKSYTGNASSKPQKQSEFSSNELSINLAKHINKMPMTFQVGQLFIPNVLYGAGAVAIDAGGGLVGAERDYGIILMLRGKDAGSFVTYDEIAGGGGTSLGIAGELTRYDYTGGNKNIALNMIEGARKKVFGGFGAVSWSDPINTNGDVIIGTTINAGISIAPLLEFGYNQGESRFRKK